MKRQLLILFCALLATASFAQNTRLVKGIVFDHEDIPLVGATITVAGMTETFQTGVNGVFEIYVSPYAKRVTIKAEGYLSQSAEIDGSYLMFKLKVDTEYVKRKAQEEEEARLTAEKAQAEKEARLAAEKAKAEEEALVAVAEQPQRDNAKHKIGDYYDDGIKKGVIFEVSTDGLHGKIVSLKQASLAWAREDVGNKSTKATSKNDGQKNQKSIQKIPDWQNKYPAWGWCANLGSDWYLPASQEMAQLLERYNEINHTLYIVGGDILINTKTTYYWSSTEFNNHYAVLVYGGSQWYGYDKLDINYVRAIATF